MSRLALCAALAAGLLCSLLCAGPAAAERKVALVIGNSAYQNVPFLPNPTKDAKAMEDRLQKAGFEVVTALDFGNLVLKRTIREFEDKATGSDIAVIFYAGHGIEIHGDNYLVPVDAKLASDRDADDEAILLDRLIKTVEGAKQLRLIILDACRDNPFAPKMKVQRTASRGISSGLAVVEATEPNTLIAYAAKAGTSALDGDGDHSPFTTALLNDLFVPGLDVRMAFGRVRDDVLKSTRSRQEPYVNGSLGAATIPLVPAALHPAETNSLADNVEAEQKDYARLEKIAASLSPDRQLIGWRVYLKQYPKGFYSDLARLQIDKLQALAAPNGPAEEQRAFDRVKDSSDPDALRDFIDRFPSSPRANIARDHLKAIEEARKAAADREAASKASADTQRRAQEAARQRAEQEAALERARQATKAAEEAQQRAEREAASEAVRKKAEAEAAAKRKEEARQTTLAEAARAKQEAACKDEQVRLTSLQTAGRGALGDLRRLAGGLACERLRPLVLAALDRANAMPAVNTPDQVRTAQIELVRLGCFSGPVDGALNDPTRAAVKRYESIRGKSTGNVDITDGFVSELRKQSSSACRLTGCPAGQVMKGDTCIAAEKAPAIARDREEHASPSAERQAKRREEERRRARAEKERAPHRREASHERARPVHREPHVIQQARGGGGGYGGGGGGGGHTTIGVGF